MPRRTKQKRSSEVTNFISVEDALAEWGQVNQERDNHSAQKWDKRARSARRYNRRRARKHLGFNGPS